ncbi:hypothetical protein K0504_10105 [Neiella marina]|uniref:Uncharacterized protein n=1 Tax=Neiella holothuriorum TaxID=2870530 RepID=A0ABS7EGB6_9GAMM|nr:FlhC family transcriptional regulator [Neiella holothuriorum]MBW8191391.1 hypothetical protein [Neiella holothuriorum]
MFSPRFKQTSDLIQLVHAGLNKKLVKAMDPYFDKKCHGLGVEFPKAKKKIQAPFLGWFAKTHGMLAGNIAYRLYLRLSPANAGITRSLEPSELLAVSRAVEVLYPELTITHNETDGLIEINRIYGLFEAIKDHRVVNYTCSRCGDAFIKEASQASRNCPWCALSSRVGSANYKVA